MLNLVLTNLQLWFYKVLISLYLVISGIMLAPIRLIQNLLRNKHQDRIFLQENEYKISKINHQRKVLKAAKNMKLGKEESFIESRNIIEVNLTEKFIIVEPGITVGNLTNQLLMHKWTLPIVPSLLKDQTIGSLIVNHGPTTDSSGHKYGLLTNSCEEYELVLPNGNCVYCSKNENSDLYHAIPTSNGKIGCITAVKLFIRPSKKYIELHYNKVSNAQEAIELLQVGSHDFVEAIQFHNSKYVVIYGDFVDYAPIGWTRTFTRWNDQLFLSEVENCGVSRNFVLAEDYFWRHERGARWIVPYFLPFLNNSMFRNTFGWLLPINNTIVNLIQKISKARLNYFNEQYTLPIESLPEFLDMVDTDLKVYPIQIFLLKEQDKATIVHTMDKDVKYCRVIINGIISSKCFCLTNNDNKVKSK